MKKRYEFDGRSVPGALTDVTVRFRRNGVGGVGFWEIRAHDGDHRLIIVRVWREETAPSNASDVECYVISPDHPELAWRGDVFATVADEIIGDYQQDGARARARLETVTYDELERARYAGEAVLAVEEGNHREFVLDGVRYIAGWRSAGRGVLAGSWVVYDARPEP